MIKESDMESVLAMYEELLEQDKISNDGAAHKRYKYRLSQKYVRKDLNKLPSSVRNRLGWSETIVVDELHKRRTS